MAVGDIHVVLKGCFYECNTYSKTLKEYMERTGYKRSQIQDWWKEKAHDNDWIKEELRRPRTYADVMWM